MIDIKKLNLENDIIDLTERNSSANFAGGKYTLFPKELINILANCFEKGGVSSMFYSGVLCRIMTSDKSGWQKGRLKVTVEFIPDDQPEEAKDELSKLRDQA